MGPCFQWLGVQGFEGMDIFIKVSPYDTYKPMRELAGIDIEIPT